MRYHTRVKVFLAQGGLGNQLFILSAALNASEILKQRVSVLLNSKTGDSIGNMTECEKVFIGESILADRYFRFASMMNYRLPDKAITSKIRKRIKIAKSLNYQFSSEELKEGRYFVGFFQNYELVEQTWKYLLPTLESQFAKNQFRVKKLIDDESYSVIHVRRGDYNSNRESFGVLSLQYYDYLLEKLKSPVIITTDDNLFVKVLRTKYREARVFGPETLNAWEALTLMSHSSCLLSANSSLSWWASFYLRSKGLPAYIPMPWFKQISDDGPILRFSNSQIARSIFE